MKRPIMLSELKRSIEDRIKEHGDKMVYVDRMDRNETFGVVGFCYDSSVDCYYIEG